MKISLALREPIAPDYEALATWITDANACTRWAGPLLPFPFSVNALPRLLQAPGATSHSMSQDGEDFLGFGQFWPRDHDAVHLGRVIVAPQARGQGLGKTLCLLLAKAALNATQANMVTLKVYRDNPAAMNTYTSLGFVAVAEESEDVVIFMRSTAQMLREKNFQ